MRPATSEAAAPNPFRDYRLDVTFVNRETGAKRVVPGYYAADGNAAQTGAASGNKWRVHFAPDKEGTWEINPTPLVPRPVPPTIAPSGSNGFSDDPCQ